MSSTLNFTSIDRGLSKIYVGLGWQAPESQSDNPNKQYDLDATCFLLDATGKTRNQSDCIYFNQLTTPCGSVKHWGDDQYGGGGDDDERIDVDLAKLPSDVEKLVFVVSIYDAEIKFPPQKFGDIKKSYIRVVDQTTNKELSRLDLKTDGRSESVIVFGELYKKNGEWRIRTLGDSGGSSLPELAEKYGVVVDRDELNQYTKTQQEKYRASNTAPLCKV